MANWDGAQRPNNSSQGKIRQFKLVLLGESLVGKSSLALKFFRNQFHEYVESTIGEEFYLVQYQKVDIYPTTSCSKSLSSEIADSTTSQALVRFSMNSSNTIPAVTKSAFLTQTVCLDANDKFEIWVGYKSHFNYTAAQAAIVVYDITNQDTFSRAKSFIKELHEANPNIVIALAGNKADLAAKRAVKHEEAQAYAEKNACIFMETSTKTDLNVYDIFCEIGGVLNSLLNESPENEVTTEEGVSALDSSPKNVETDLSNNKTTSRETVKEKKAVSSRREFTDLLLHEDNKCLRSLERIKKIIKNFEEANGSKKLSKLKLSEIDSSKLYDVSSKFVCRHNLLQGLFSKISKEALHSMNDLCKNAAVSPTSSVTKKASLYNLIISKSSSGEGLQLLNKCKLCTYSHPDVAIVIEHLKHHRSLSNDYEDENWCDIEVESLTPYENELPEKSRMCENLKSSQDKLDIFYKFVQDQKQFYKTENFRRNIIKEAGRLKIRSKIVFILCKCLLGLNIITDIKTHKQLFCQFTCYSLSGQQRFLGGLEYVINLHKKDLMNKVESIMKFVHNSNLVEKHVLINWLQKVSDKYVSIDVSLEIRKAAKSYILSLENAEKKSDTNAVKMLSPFDERVKDGSVVTITNAGSRGISSPEKSYDTDDIQEFCDTTNLYLGNLNPKITELELYNLFGQYGPIASMNLMRPPSNEIPNVLFMNREDAAVAMKELNGTAIMGFKIKICWGNPLPLPEIPVYIPSSSSHLSYSTSSKL